MRDQLSTLEELQNVDIEIRKIEKDLEKYPREISLYNNELDTKKESITNKKSNIEELNKIKVKLELELQHNNDNIKNSENKLFEIKTHKEYEALQKEIAETKRNNAEIEEQILLKMEELDLLESEISEEESKLSTLTEEYNKKISENEKKIEELKANYDPIKEEKNKLAAKVDPKILPIYERIANRTGEALALAENERCMSCNMNIPPQLFNEVLTQNKIVLCPNCKKILYTSHEEEKT